MKKTILILLAVCAGVSLQAQEAGREADSLRYVFGRQQVEHAVRQSSPYADTLDTGNPGVKVVLYNNGTYRYVKDQALVAADSVFTECWDTRAVNPYREKPDAIPDRFSIWEIGRAHV